MNDDYYDGSACQQDRVLHAVRESKVARSQLSLPR